MFRHKFLLFASLMLGLSGGLGAENPDSPGLHVAHPWEPAAPVAQPAVAAPASSPASLSMSNWTALGPAPITNGQRPGGGPVSGRIAGIAADPGNANNIYVAPAGGGVWKTTDGGSSWTALTDAQATLSMGAIAIAPSNSQVIYAGTGEANNSGDSNFGRGVLVSTDGGATWTLRNASGAFDRKAIAEIAVDPGNANVVYVAVSGGGNNGLGGNNGIWKSIDGGATWTNTTSSITSSNPWTSVRIDVNNPAVLYAAVGNIFGDAANGVYKTTNGGSTWTLLANAPGGNAAGRIVVAVSKSNSQVVYVSACGNGNGGSTAFGALYKIERSDNGGSTFTDLTGGTPNYMGGQGWYDTTLLVDPSNAAIVYAAGAAGNNSVLRSTNSGVNWSDINSVAGAGPHVDHHAAAFDATGKYLDGDDGGIYRYDPAVPSWTQLNGNTAFLNTIQFTGIGLHPTDVNTALGGSQDNGTERYTGTLSWALVEGGDGGLVKFSRTNPSRVYHQAPVESFGAADFFRRSDNGGTSWTGKVSGITDNTDATQNFYAPFAVDPGNGDRVLFGARHVWESTNGGDAWNALGAAFASNIDAIGLAPSDSNTIYVGANGSTFVTTDHGVTWTPRNLPVPGLVTGFEVDHANSQIAYAVIGQFTSGGNVFKTTNGGATWSNISGNLANLPVWSFQADPNVANVYYVGADNGVYITTDGGANWSRLGAGLPDAQVFQIELNSTLGVLGAATHGRGAWEILIPIPTTLTYTGNTAADYHDGAQLSATLVVKSTSAAISGVAVHFTLGSQSCDGTTNASGIASCSLTLSQTPGNYTVTAAFAGSGPYSPSADSKSFTITKEETTLTYTGDLTLINGSIAHLSGQLLEDGAVAIAGRTVTFALGSGPTPQTCNAVTDGTGTAACVINGVDQPLGPGTVSASFAGDAFYLPASASTNTLILSPFDTGLQFRPVTPCRLVDTRNPNGPLGGPEIAAGATRTFVPSSAPCGIPTTAAAYALNITVVPDSTLGYLTVWPAGQPQPLVSTLNSDGRIKANAVIAPAGNNGAVSVFVTDSTHVIIDINGYFLPDNSQGAGLQFYPLPPCRVADTRGASGPLGGPFLAGGATGRPFPVRSSNCNIPASAQAYSMNFTAVPHGPLGYLTVWPTGQGQPFVSTLNASTGAITANAAIIPAGSNGNISVFATNDTDLVIDVNGYFAPASAGGLDLYNVSPCRVIDTRNGGGAFTGTIVVNPTGSTTGGSCLQHPPTTPLAYVFNATVIPQGPLGFLTLWPDGQTRPVVSTLNALDGAITSNMAIVPTNNTSIDAFVTNPANLVVDIFGYFAPFVTR